MIMMMMIVSMESGHPDAIFVDIGANIGMHALYAAALNKTVVFIKMLSFKKILVWIIYNRFYFKTFINYSLSQVLAAEPSYENWPHLHRAVQLNNYLDRFTLFPYAMSDQRSSVTMSKDADNLGAFVDNILVRTTCTVQPDRQRWQNSGENVVLEYVHENTSIVPSESCRSIVKYTFASNVFESNVM